MQSFKFSAVFILCLALAACNEADVSNSVARLKSFFSAPSQPAQMDQQLASVPIHLLTIRQNKLDDLSMRSEKGDVQSMYDLGRAYVEGSAWDNSANTSEHGITDTLIDLTKAEKWFDKAAIRGHADAQYRLGRLLIEKQRQNSADLSKGLNWLYKAAKQDQPDATYLLGNIYQKGELVQQDFFVSFQYIERSAELGNADGKNELALKYLRGIPNSKTMKCLEKFGKAIIEQNSIELSRCSNKPNEKLAVIWWENAAMEGNYVAQFNLATHLRERVGNPKNASRALALYETVANRQILRPVDKTLIVLAQSSLFEMYYDGEGAPKNHTKAVEWGKKAASAGDVNSQANLGLSYYKGEGVSVDLVLGYAWLNIAASKGLENAVKGRDFVETKMTPDQLAEAQRLSSSWKPDVVLARETNSVSIDRHSVSSGSVIKVRAGSGFVVNRTGKVITNNHVVESCREVRINGRTGIATIVVTDKANDLALLEVPGNIDSSATIGNTPEKLRQGEEIVVFGYPLNSLLSSVFWREPDSRSY